MWGKGILEAGVRWRVGNGTSIQIYKDKWILRPSTFKILSNSRIDSNAKVVCLMSLLEGWDEQVEDTVVWHFEERGVYSVKSGYIVGVVLEATLSASNNLAVGRWWKVLRNLNIPLKIKIFIWKTCHEWIPSRINLLRRGIQMDVRCPLCGNAEETTLHSLWECWNLKYARMDWLPRNKTPRVLWCVRNCFLHERKRHDVSEAMSWSLVLLHDFQRKNHGTSVKAVKPLLDVIKWNLSDQRRYKINCKVVLDNGKSLVGVGSIIGEASGFVMASCALRFAAGNYIWAANALAILKSCHFASDCGLFPFLIESNAKRVVNRITNFIQLNSRYGDILQDIERLRL
ncbi:hypothetical protein Dsin_012116 [Dipteronia sinensis]|uniref:Reverse transcriptase zinc-binding domain-containing protein n=1 Tax=Dipteronia sinensis TaxID=43782 RepID=A0AAE0AHP7_9ROSI|nr:hypothetical protein Dsin_012116 [Dipteronia sinensis]